MKRCRLIHSFRWAACATLLAGIVSPPAQATTLIEDYESFADTAALNATQSFSDPDTTTELSLDAGVGGSQALLFTGNNGAGNFFSQAEFDITPTSLLGIDAVTVQVKGIVGGGDTLEIQLKNEFGGVEYRGDRVAISSFPTDGFATYTVDTSGDPIGFDGLGRLAFFFSANDFGTASVVIDDITLVPAVPEPASLAFVTTAFAALAARRRRG